MKTKSIPPVADLESLSESDIREYAYHLYVQSGYIPGRDLENWFEARDYLSAFTSKLKSDSPLRDQPRNRKRSTAAAGQAA